MVKAYKDKVASSLVKIEHSCNGRSSLAYIWLFYFPSSFQFPLHVLNSKVLFPDSAKTSTEFPMFWVMHICKFKLDCSWNWDLAHNSETWTRSLTKHTSQICLKYQQFTSYNFLDISDNSLQHHLKWFLAPWSSDLPPKSDLIPKIGTWPLNLEPSGHIQGRPLKWNRNTATGIHPLS